MQQGANHRPPQQHTPPPQRAQGYIRPVAKGKMLSDNYILTALVVILVISFVVLISFAAKLVTTNKQLEQQRIAQEALAEELRIQAELLAAQATAMLPMVEPQIEPAEYTNSTDTIKGIDSEYAILIDIEENRVVAHKNGDAKIYPASMTKVMTLIVANEHLTDMSELFTFDYTITDPAYKAGASVAGFSAGESVPMIDIMYGIALPSGADATTATAIKVAGSEAAFAELMNKKAEEMGLENTHFVNASGLHDKDHYSTPHEIARIMEYAMEIPALEEILSTYKYTTTPTPQHPDGITLVSTLFSRMYGDEPEVAEVIAGKTGYTNEAGQCLVSVAETESGRRFVLVTANAVGRYAPVYDAIDVYKDYLGEY